MLSKNIGKRFKIMKKLFKKIYKLLDNFQSQKVLLKNDKLTTIIQNFYAGYSNDLTDLSKAFNIISNDNSNNNYLNTVIIQDNNTFEELNNFMLSAKLCNTDFTNKFNSATKSSSIIKCSVDHNFYIMKCYDYFFYLFNKQTKESIMLVTDNYKAKAMINILLLTPYVMMGELNVIHGGLVNKKDKNVLISNSSLGGKTTLAILFADHDWNIVTEENTYVSKNGYILPFNVRNYFNIRAGTYLTFKDFFLRNNIKYEPFLAMDGMSASELFKYEKKEQLSIDFRKLGKPFTLPKQKITHSIRISLVENSNLIITQQQPHSLVDSFLQICTSPTVELFQELLNFKGIDISKRIKNLNKIVNNINNFEIITGLDYKNNFDKIINTMELQ